MIGVCEHCGIKAEIDIHHKDKSHKNNDPGNLERLCRWCHRVADGKHSRRPLAFNEVRMQYQACFPRQ